MKKIKDITAIIALMAFWILFSMSCGTVPEESTNESINEPSEVAQRREEFKNYTFNYDYDIEYAGKFKSIIENADYITAFPEIDEADVSDEPEYIIEFEDDVPDNYKEAINRAAIDNGYGSCKVLGYEELELCNVLVAELDNDLFIFVDYEGTVTGYLDSYQEIKNLYPHWFQ